MSNKTILLPIFVFLVVGIVTAGGFLYRNQRDSCRTEAEHKLTAVADLKVRELSAWRKERLADAGVFYKNSAFSALVKHCMEQPRDLPLQEELRSWLSRVEASYRFSRVTLFDTKGNTWMMVSDSKEPITAATTQYVHQTLASGKVTLEDFYRNMYTKKIYLRLFIPILDTQAGGRPLGVLMFRINPNVFLYPLILRWPTPSETAETLLICREGNEAVFLNELRFQKNTTLDLRMSLDNTDLPAVQAVLGKEGIVKGIDYRGMPVLAAVRAIPDSPWYMVARMDLAEVYAPMKERFLLTILFVVAFLFGVAAAMGFLWRQQHAALYKQKYEMEHQYRNLFENSHDAFMILESPSLKFAAGNPAMLKMFGLKDEQELIALGPWDLSPERQPDGSLSSEKVRKVVEETVRKGSHFFEWRHKRTNGEEFPATVLLTKMEQAGKLAIQATVRDVTEQKRAQAIIEQDRYELEQRVKDRTAELAATNTQLQLEVEERKLSQKALYEEQQTLRHLLQASDQERQAIAYEIHDELAQQLTGAIMQFQTFEALKDTEPEHAMEAYQAGINLLNQGHSEARRLISGVRPPILDESGIVAAIDHLITEQYAPQGQKLEYYNKVHFDRLTPTLENAIYRIAQEGVANACHHSKSSKVRISLVQRKDWVRIKIRDWGIGFDSEAISKERFGLEGIKQRARLLGGKCNVLSIKSKGTSVTVDLPLLENETDPNIAAKTKRDRVRLDEPKNEPG